MASLRALLSARHQRVFQQGGLADRLVEDPLQEERLHRACTQVTAAFALYDALQEMGVEVNTGQNSLDLEPLVSLALVWGLINLTEAGVLRRINHMANEAKHQVAFRSRL